MNYHPIISACAHHRRAAGSVSQICPSFAPDLHKKIVYVAFDASGPKLNRAAILISKLRFTSRATQLRQTVLHGSCSSRT
jgi:hypothetical protein